MLFCVATDFCSDNNGEASADCELDATTAVAAGVTDEFDCLQPDVKTITKLANSSTSTFVISKFTISTPHAENQHEV